MHGGDCDARRERQYVEGVSMQGGISYTGRERRCRGRNSDAWQGASMQRGSVHAGEDTAMPGKERRNKLSDAADATAVGRLTRA